MEQNNKLQDDCTSPRGLGHGRIVACFSWLIGEIRHPLTAYLVVMSTAVLAFAILSHGTDVRLARQDYEACVAINEVLAKANDKNDRILTVIISLADESQVGIYEQFASQVVPYKLRKCEKLKP
jgi:hypothetical protein